jgi:hypothetical protein
MSQLRHTYHAIERQARRNLSDDDIAFVLTYGRRERIRGALHVYLGKRDIPADAASNSRIARLEGTTLVMGDTDSGPVFITVYRNRRGLRRKTRR